MFIKLFIVVVLASSAASRNVPRYTDLDEEDQVLFRAAYDTPSYSHAEYEEDDLPIGKLDLLKDGLWVIKAKIKEMKTFNKALAANLLSTKLQVKEMLANHLKTLKKHHHIEIEKGHVYNYQSPPSPSVYPQHETPHYAPPASQYEPPHYAPPAPQYEPPHYAPPAPQYEPPHYAPPAPQYEPPHIAPPAPQYEPPHYAAPVPQYEAHQHGAPQYGPPQYPHDPYYGH